MNDAVTQKGDNGCFSTIVKRRLRGRKFRQGCALGWRRAVGTEEALRMVTTSTTQTGRAVALLVEDDRVAARSIARVMRPHFMVEVFGTRAAGQARLLALQDWPALLVVDVGLPDGSGLALAAVARAAHPSLPILVVTGDDSVDTNHGAFLLGARLLLKPFGVAELQHFIGEMVAPLAKAADLLAQLACFSEAHGLSLREREVLGLAMRGLGRQDMVRQLALSENTLQTVVRRVLTKCNAGTLASVAAKAWSFRGGARTAVE